MNVARYSLHEVKTPAEIRQWLDFPKKIYKHNAQWVCPLDPDIEEVFDPKKNDLFEDGEAIRWICRGADGETVGRIAAFYNRKKAATEEQPTGGCGFFESINDREVAFLMFDAAKKWLSERGMEAMDGPINFGQRRDWWGCLVEGFEYQPLYRNPYNLPYYKDLFEAYGFQNYFNQNSFIWRVNSTEANKLIFSRAEHLYANPGYHVEHINMAKLKEAAEDFRIIYNKAWSMFTGVKPITHEEAMQLMETMKPIIDPNIIYFAYYNEEPIGFFITVPDLNRLIGKFNGKFGIVQKLRMMWDLKVAKKCDRAFALIFGITPEYHGKGVESAMMVEYWHYIEERNKTYKTMELAWVGDFNPVMNRMVERYVCAEKHKMHTTYRYLFDRTKEFHRCPRLGLKRPER